MIKPESQDWSNVLNDALSQEEFKTFYKNLCIQRRHAVPIYPQSYDVWNALNFCPLYKVKVVILGQDPYHGKSQADGLAFSVRHTQELPPSLKNIFRAIKTDLRINNEIGDLRYWAYQGVLLLNTVLTVEKGKPLSHKGMGWENVTDKIIEAVNELDWPIVWMLWGNEAKKKKSLLTNSNHLVLETSHPSPLSAHQGFLFCKHFSKCNTFLRKNGLPHIDWKTMV